MAISFFTRPAPSLSGLLDAALVAVPLWASFGAVLMAVPSSALARDEVPDAIYNVNVASAASMAADALPEGSNVEASFLNPQYDPNLRLAERAQLSVTFLGEGAGYRNALGFFTYADGAFDNLTKGDVDTDGSGVVSISELDAVAGVDVDIIFPNASASGAGGRLNQGDSVDLGDGRIFDAGSVVGFFLLQDAWNGSAISGFDNSADRQAFYTLDFLNPEAGAVSDQDSDSAADSSRHAAMMFSGEQVILGFEDLNRVQRADNRYGYATDDDFNDAVFIVHASPFSAIASSNIPVAAQVPEPGSLGLVGLGLLFGWIALRRPS